jgi:hypothetical protein
MFFRDKKSPTSINPVLQLVENQRINKKIRQRVIISLGTHFELPKNLRKQTAQAIEQKLLGQTGLWFDAQCSEFAERIIKKIQTDGKWHSLRDQVSAPGQGELQKDEYAEDNPIAEVFVNQVEHKDDRVLGPLLIGTKMWEVLQFEKTLQEVGISAPQIKTAQISVLNRFISGDSENAIPSWIKVTGIEDLVDPKAEEYSRDRFYRISDKLLSHKAKIEESIYKHSTNHFDSQDNIFLYDLTNTYFEGQQASNPKASHSKNQKEKRSDCPQIVVAIVLNGAGFLRKHFVFEGKLTDVASLSHILISLEEDLKTATLPTIIMDRGLTSSDNIQLLKDKNLHYIIASRREEELRNAASFSESDYKTIKEVGDNKVEVKIIDQDGEKKLLCKSSGRERKESAMRNLREERLEKDFELLEQRVNQGRLVKPSDVQQKIGRLKERHRSVAKYYYADYKSYSFSFDVKPCVPKRLINSLSVLKKKADDYLLSHKKLEKNLEKLKNKYGDDYLKIDIQLTDPIFEWGLEEQRRDQLIETDGNYILKTNREDMSDEQIWQTYVMLTKVEKAFRNFKTDLGLRPNYHQLEGRVEGHVFITVLAYHLLHATEYMLRNQNCSLSWKSVNRLVSSHTYSTIVLPTTKGEVIHLRKPSIPEQVHKEIYDKLNIDYTKLKSTKIVA